ncbi:MAG: TIR domain-containing protein [Ruminococcaceae bacterium]|nr:TIR domain-containing protein [Oscillospiraceae bacterium]
MQDTICKIKTRPPSKDEKRLFGIFISHSNEDLARVKSLVAYMKSQKLIPIYDKQFLKGGQDYLLRIQKCLKCYAGVLVVTKNALNSDWVSYECGYLRSLGMPVYLWDPDGVFTLDAKETDTDLFNTHISQYLPAYRTMESLVEALKERSVYSDIFTQECSQIHTDQFHEMLQKNVETVMLRITSPNLMGKKDLFRGCKLGTLVVNFGMFYPNQGDGVHCWAQRTVNDEGEYVTDEAPLLKNGTCELSKRPCAMFSDEKLHTDKPDCVILNHVIFNGHYFDRNEPDFDNKTLEDDGLLTFYVPVHKHYGTEFKFIIDAPSNQKHHDLLRLFEKMGLNPTISDSLNTWRIYLSLPETPSEGLFRLEQHFHNNFLCPRALQDPQKRVKKMVWGIRKTKQTES